MTWQRIRGHELQVAAFNRVVARGRLAHAYLFTGPSGIGKRLFAQELARALLCEALDRSRLEACDQCPACIQSAAGTHPDLYQARRPEESLEVPIELVRELCKSFGLKSARGRGKIAILDDADDLNDASANCFLKTLEEPPPRSVLLLVGTSAERQLPTILSRCQVVHFRPPPIAAVAGLLSDRGIEPAWAARLATIADGSPGQALGLADKALWEFRRALLDGLSRVPCDALTIARNWQRFTEEAGKESADQRRRTALVLRLLIDFYRRALAADAGVAPALAEAEDQHVLEALISRASCQQLLAFLDRCLEAEMQLERRVQLVLVIEALVYAIAQRLQAS